jgi:hypothetical protein
MGAMPRKPKFEIQDSNSVYYLVDGIGGEVLAEIYTSKDAIEIARKLNAFDELIEDVSDVAEFLNGEGDVAQIAFRKLREAIRKAEAPDAT